MAGPGGGKEAQEYHEATKHSPVSIRLSLHRLDWANKPRLFKVYEDRVGIPLPLALPSPDRDALEALAAPPEGDASLDDRTLAAVLYHAAGITKRARTPTGEWYYFRAAACAGALYPIELYVVAGKGETVSSGVYHFAPKDFALVPLREGDHRPHLAWATGLEQVDAAAYVVLSAIFWRSAWKYQARCYRYCFWDSGTILANLLATAAAVDVRAEVLLGFADREVNHLLGLDGRREAALAVVPLGRSPVEESHPQDLSPPEAEAAPLSEEEVTYPVLERLHEAAGLRHEEVAAWKGPLPREGVSATDRATPLPSGAAHSRPLGEVIRRRGSTRRFRLESIHRQQLGAILHAATRRVPADFLGGPETSLLDLYLTVQAVEGLPAGAYYYEPAENRLLLLKEGEFRRTSGFLALEQSLAAEASATVFFLADLKRVLQRYGDRGYRAAQLEAGLLGGRMYLAAYAQGLGATGLTFYDDEITEFFSPHAEGKAAIFLVALGRPARVTTGVEPVAGPAPGRG